ncbi:unnamed protein product [Clonostachys rhizophaga]|uniref:Fumarylacetoacetase-like C-terminal domain-containing protein n=1 Tax=Clonostachys rhizophaga TaxID=160324 RepID=A0A9N9V269_9HYPO|nr:unnamed protein product [Clonostachys rhizophaga]
MGVSTFIRFQDDQGYSQYGEPALEDLAGNLLGATVDVLEGNPFDGLRRTGLQGKVGKVLCPLTSTPIILCIGLNYKQHAEETGLSVTPNPVLFTKSPTALSGPYDDVHVHPDATPMLDYEGELVVVIGKEAKNVSDEDALDYVLGYTMGNDISARNFQLPAVSGGQFCYAKSFDTFAPIGPAITTTEAIPDPQDLAYITRVNGEHRQATPTNDMIWTVRQIIAHLSRGTTLKEGTVIMTGTPSGVGLFMKPKAFLRDQDIVEVVMEGYGGLRNKIVFE